MLKKRRKIIRLGWFLLLLGFSLPEIPAQQFFYSQSSKAGKIKIPFEYENNFIVVRVMFNNLIPLKFIFDTGAEHTILTKREITDLMQVSYRRKFPIRGADMSTIMYAYLATGITLQLDNFVALNRPILVLEEDVFGFEEFAGLNVQGIIGADIFKRYVVKIDYRRQMITLYDPQRFDPPRKYEEFPIEISNGKPYLFADLKLLNDIEMRSKFLLDTGAGLALVLYTDTDERLVMPDNVIRSNIGMGLGGYLEGFLGRVDQFAIDEYKLGNVITNFQDVMPMLDSTFLNNRNGIIGNLILDRFTLIIDYVRDKLYLKPFRKRFKEKFRYDRSGITLVNSGELKNRTTVFYVVPGSPADEAGVEPGDEILKYNGRTTKFFTLDRLSRKLRGKPGKRIRLLLQRDNKEFEVIFRLRELI